MKSLSLESMLKVSIALVVIDAIKRRTKHIVTPHKSPDDIQYILR